MKNTSITFSGVRKITPDEFVDILKRSSLAERRPVDNPDRIYKMLHHADILITAWDGDYLVGVSRAIADFSFCCYLSDLAVDVAYQHRGIGKELIARTHELAGRESKLILLAAPAAEQYYPRIGMTNFKHCYVQ